MSFPINTMPGEIIPAAPSPPLALTDIGRIAPPPMIFVADAPVPGNTDPCGSIGNDAVGAPNLKFDGATEVDWDFAAESMPAAPFEYLSGSSVRPSVFYSAEAQSSTAHFCGGFGGCGGGASSSWSSNNPPRAPARAPIYQEAPPLPDHQIQRSHRLAPPSQTGAIRRRGNIYSDQLRGNYQSWGAPNGHYGNQHHDERDSYRWHYPQGPGHNLYTGIPLPRPPVQGHTFIPPPTWVPNVYAAPRAHGQPSLSPMGYNGVVVPTYNAQFVPHFDTYQSVPFDTYRAPFSNFQRPVASTIRIRSPVDNRQLSLKRQIEYYFSVDNLCKDSFLRSKMDDQGWVPVSLIATFNMVKRVTTNTTEILNALRGSTVLEIQAEKIRRREDWMRWLMPSMRNPNGHRSTSQSASNHDDSVIHPLQTLGLEDSSSQTTMSRAQTEVRA